MAVINGDSGDNTLNGTASADTITGAGGNDTINGNGGNDTIYGDDAQISNAMRFLDWSAEGADGTSLANGFTQTSGGMQVTVDLQDDGAGTSAEVSTNQSAQYAAANRVTSPGKFPGKFPGRSDAGASAPGAAGGASRAARVRAAFIGPPFGSQREFGRESERESRGVRTASRGPRR